MAMNKKLQDSLISMYNVCDQIDHLPNDGMRTTVRSSREILREELIAYVGFLTARTSLSMINAVRFVRDYIDPEMSETRFMQLQQKTSCTRDSFRTQIPAMMKSMVKVDNYLFRGKEGNADSIGRTLFVVYGIMSAEILKYQRSSRSSVISAMEAYLENLRQYLTHELSYLDITPINLRLLYPQDEEPVLPGDQSPEMQDLVPQQPAMQQPFAGPMFSQPGAQQPAYNQPARPVTPQQPAYNQPARPLTPQQPAYNQPARPLTPQQPAYNQPTRPVTPQQPAYNQPARPVTPQQPAYNQPTRPVTPQQPAYNQPARPVTPQQPAYNQPVRPVTPQQPAYNQPVRPVTPQQPAYNQPTRPVTPPTAVSSNQNVTRKQTARRMQPTGRELHAGERVDLTPYTQQAVSFILSYESLAASMEIDSYAFMLGANGKVFGDSDLIFFHNPDSEDGAVSALRLNEFPAVTVKTNLIPQQYEKVAICFSAYGDQTWQNFSQLEKPLVQIAVNGEEVFHIDFSHLKNEKTAVAIELYRHKGIWKLRVVAAGYYGKLRSLCEDYGVEVE